MDIDIGSQATLSVEDRKLVARPEAPSLRRYSLKELLKGGKAVERLNVEVAWAKSKRHYPRRQIG